MVKAKLQNENREDNQGIREKLVKGLVEYIGVKFYVQSVVVVVVRDFSKNQ